MTRSGSQAERLRAFLRQASEVARNEPLDSETWSRLRIMALEQGLPEGSWEDQVRSEYGTEPDVTWIDPAPMDVGIEFKPAKPPQRASRRPPLPPPPPTDSVPLPPPPPPDVVFNEIHPLDLNADEIQFVYAESQTLAEDDFLPGPPARRAANDPSSGADTDDAPVESKPPRKKRRPKESFERYANKAMSLMSTPVLTRKKEEKLVAEGCDKLSLSKTLARWIIHDVAAQRGIPVLSLQEAESQGGGNAEESARLEAFMERVAPILAEQRGVNARSRMLMEAVSQELGLSHDEFEKSMELLQGGGEPQEGHEVCKNQIELRETDFREFLDETLPNLPRGIVTAVQERELSDAGVDRFGVAESRASQLIRESCSDLNLRYISSEQATQHIAELIDEKLAAASWLSTDVGDRIVAEGEQWGLTDTEVIALMETAIEVHRRQKKKSRQIATAALAASLLLVFAAIGAGAWVAWQYQENPAEKEIANQGDSDSEPTASTDGSSEPNPESKIAEDSDWLDRDLTLAITSARVGWSETRPHLSQLHDGVTLERDEAYQALFRLGEAEESKSRRELLIDILAGAYALEPNEANAMRMIERFAVSLRHEAPFEDRRVEQMFWILQVAVAAITREGTPESRRGSMARLLSDVLGTVIDPSGLALDLNKQCASALCRQLYRKLGKAVTLPPEKFAQAMSALASVAHMHLDESEFERLEVQLLTDAIRGSSSRWEELAPQLRRRAASDNSNTILTLVELLERSENDELKQFLGRLFESRSDLVRTSVTTDSVADEVRKNLGVPRETTFDDRWIQFDRLSQEALDGVVATEQPAEILRQAVRLAHSASAGRSLALRELGTASFDKLLSDGAPKIDTIGAGVSGGRGRRRASGSPSPMMSFGSPDFKQRLEQLFRSLRGTSRVTARIGYLRLIAETGKRIDQLSPSYCYQLGEYLASPKQRLEHQEMMDLVPEFRRWKHLRLALADEVVDSSAKDPQLNEVVTTIAQQSFPQTDVNDWKRAVRRSLLKSVIAQTSSGGASEIRDLSVIDRAAKVLRNIYAERARVMGAPSDQADAAESPPQALNLVIDRIAARLSGKRQTPKVKSLLAALPHERAAVDYAADNELSRVAMLQRLALRMITLEALQQRSERSDAIERNLDELAGFDSSAKSVLDQILEAERRTVKLWRIVNEP